MAVSEPSDVEPPVPPAAPDQTGPGHHEVSVDLSAFLPEGTELAAADDPWDTGAPEPEVPAWALDDPPAAPSAAADAPAPAPDVAPQPAPPVDGDAAAALDRIDADLAAVDDALVALDAGAPERSPLLRDLLGG